MASCTSPRVSLMTLPISRVMSRASSSFRAISSSAALYSISARRGAGTRRHFLKAWRAASMAWSTSSLADFWKMPTTSRVSAGFRFSKVRPVRVSTHSPAMKFLKILGFATAPMLADVCSIVAIRLPSTANCKPSMLSGGWRLVIPTEDEGCVHHGGTAGTESSLFGLRFHQRCHPDRGLQSERRDLLLEHGHCCLLFDNLYPPKHHLPHFGTSCYLVDYPSPSCLYLQSIT